MVTPRETAVAEALINSLTEYVGTEKTRAIVSEVTAAVLAALDGLPATPGALGDEPDFRPAIIRGLEARFKAVLAACEMAEAEARHVVDDEVYVSVGLIRNALRATTPDTGDTLRALDDDVLAQCIADPGSIVGPRRHDDGESVPRWGVRAIRAALAADPADTGGPGE